MKEGKEEEQSLKQTLLKQLNDSILKMNFLDQVNIQSLVTCLQDLLWWDMHLCSMNLADLREELKADWPELALDPAALGDFANVIKTVRQIWKRTREEGKGIAIIEAAVNSNA